MTDDVLIPVMWTELKPDIASSEMVDLLVVKNNESVQPQGGALDWRSGRAAERGQGDRRHGRCFCARL